MTIREFDQGDIIFEKIEKLPDGPKEIVADGVVAKGEVTGHAHRIVGGTVMKFLNEGLFVQVDDRGRLIHEEHDSFELPAGIYRVRHQREYTVGDVRQVVD